MGCLFVVLSLLTPRFVLLILWISTSYLDAAYGSWFWPTAGFFFLPTTAIGYAVARHEFTAPGGGIEAAGVVVIVLAIALDVGLIGNGGWNRRRAITR